LWGNVCGVNLAAKIQRVYEQLFNTISQKVTLTAGEQETLKKFFIPKKIRKRQFLLNAGDVCQHSAFVERGLLRSYSIDENAHEHVMQFAPEGWWISDMGSYFSGDPSVYNIEAVEDSELLLVTRAAQAEMIETIPAMEKYFRMLLQRHVVALQRRLTNTMSLTAEEKYTVMMDKYPDLIARVPQQQMASYLGITPETLSRIRKSVSRQK
jgi:CRP-like cAMP-binding protein